MSTTIAESNILLRARLELPAGAKVATDQFLADWGRMRSGGLTRLEKKVQTRGWNFIGMTAGTVHSGVGDTSEKAVASALEHALELVNAESNAVEVKSIELTHYPWFCLARVRLNPYRIQQGDARPAHALNSTVEA
jgi:hypothetical protein